MSIIKPKHEKNYVVLWTYKRLGYQKPMTGRRLFPFNDDNMVFQTQRAVEFATRKENAAEVIEVHLGLHEVILTDLNDLLEG